MPGSFTDTDTLHPSASQLVISFTITFHDLFSINKTMKILEVIIKTLKMKNKLIS